MTISTTITDNDLHEGVFVRVCCNEWMRNVNASMAAMTGHWVRITRILAPARDGEGRYSVEYYTEDNLSLPELPKDVLMNNWAWRAYMFDTVSPVPQIHPVDLPKKNLLPDI